MPRIRQTDLKTVGISLLGAGLSAALIIALTHNRVDGTDFLSFYAGGRLAVTGHLYDPQAIWKAQFEAAGRYGPGLLFIRLPCFALFLWPLAQASYGTARVIWLAINIAAVATAVWLWPGSRKLAAIVACWSFPVFMCLGDGTDTLFLFLWLVLWRRSELKNRQFWAGLALSLCVAKFHLFLLLPLALVRHRRWSEIRGSAIGISILLIASFVGAGWHWPAQYLHVLTLPELNPARVVMPNIHGLVSPGLETPMVALTLILTCLAILKLDYTDSTIAALIGSFLCSYHAYVMDGVILLPVILMVIEKHRSRPPTWPAYAAAFFITPIPWLAVLMRGP